MFELEKEECRSSLGFGKDEKILLSYGGSLGAKVVNATVFEMIEKEMLDQNVRHIHATGNGYWDAACEKFVPQGFTLTDENTLEKGKTTLKRYIYNMPRLMACADAVICRAGAMTLTEVAMMRKPSILIPSPNVTDNHQYKNAKVLSDASAAVLIEESELTDEVILNEVTRLYESTEYRNKMAENVSNFAIKDTNKSIYTEIKKLLKL
jgi:UDP-N-acetylglucosamine--N-acetylmuramyl-(pentapeptide) pyrophosphoryl-undecaprenol N-acetylglucosamine transferase